MHSAYCAAALLTISLLAGCQPVETAQRPIDLGPMLVFKPHLAGCVVLDSKGREIQNSLASLFKDNQVHAIPANSKINGACLLDMTQVLNRTVNGVKGTTAG